MFQDPNGRQAPLSPEARARRLEALRSQWEESGELSRVLGQEEQATATLPQPQETQEDPNTPPQTPEAPDASSPDSDGGIVSNTTSAVLRGAGQAVNETASFLTGLLPGVDEGWKPIDEESLPEQPTGGAYAFIEGMSQFAVGMLGAGKVLKPLKIGRKLYKGLRGIGVGRKPSKVAAMAAPFEVAGSASDFVAFDPYEQRVSDLVANGPVEVARPVGEFLQADSDDPELWARTKAATEGAMLGLVLGGTIATTTALVRRSGIMKRLRAGQIDEGQAQRELSETERQMREDAERLSEDEALGIYYDAEGTPLIEVKNVEGYEATPAYFLDLAAKKGNREAGEGSLQRSPEDPWEAARAQGFDPEVHTRLWHVTTGDEGVMAVGLKSAPPEEYAHGGGLGGHAEDVSTTWNREHAEAIEKQLKLRARAANDDTLRAEEIVTEFEELAGDNIISFLDGSDTMRFFLDDLTEALAEARSGQTRDMAGQPSPILNTIGNPWGTGWDAPPDLREAVNRYMTSKDRAGVTEGLEEELARHPEFRQKMVQAIKEAYGDEITIYRAGAVEDGPQSWTLDRWHAENYSKRDGPNLAEKASRPVITGRAKADDVLVVGNAGEDEIIIRGDAVRQNSSETASSQARRAGVDDMDRLRLEIQADRKALIEAMDAAENLGYEASYFDMMKMMDTELPNSKALNSVTELEDWDGINPENIKIKQVIAKPDAEPRVLDTEFEIAFREQDIEVLERVEARTEQQVAAWNSLYQRRRTDSGALIPPAPRIREALGRLRQRIDEGADPTDADLYRDLGMNLGLLTRTFDDFKAVHRSMVEAFREDVSAARNRVKDGHGKTWDDTEEGALQIMAEKLFGPGKTLRDVEEWFRSELGHGDYLRLDEQIQAAHKASMLIGQDIAKVARAADMATGSEKATLEALLEDMMGSFASIQVRLGAIDSQSGRILNAKKMAGQSPDVAKAHQKAMREVADTAESALEGLTRTQLRELARDLTLTNGDPELIRKALLHAADVAKHNEKPGTRMDKAISFRTNMLLSGPKTHLVNTLNNILTSFQVPLEYWWGGVRSGNREMAAFGRDMIPGMADVADALKMLRETWRKGQNILDPAHKISEETLDASPLANFGAGAKYLSEVPGRALMAADEFFKVLNYRSNLRAQALRMARQDAAEKGLTGAARDKFLAQRVADKIESAFDAKTGAGTNPWALQHARYTTFTNDLEYGIGKSLRDAANEHHLIRLIMPFIRTPTNLIRFAWQRTPVLNQWQRQWAEDMKAGGERAAYAKARNDVGIMLYGSGIMLALGGRLTGGGPSDYRLKAQMQSAGWQPYSVKVGGKYISYRRIEPLATALQLVGDFGEAVGELDEQTAMEGATALIASMSASMTSKTYLTGLVDFMDAVSEDNPHKTQRVLNNFITSWTPNLARQVAQATDPLYRDTRNLIDEFRARAPGFSDELEPRRNAFGEPVLRPPGTFNRSMNPFTTMKAPDDEDLAWELAQLGRAIPMPAETRYEGELDLRDREKFDNGTGQSPYDRLLELMGDPKSGPSLRESIERLVQSPAWDRLGSGNDTFEGGGKYEKVRQIVARYQQRAYKQILMEYPNLRAEDLALRRLKADSFLATSVLKADEARLNP